MKKSFVLLILPVLLLAGCARQAHTDDSYEAQAAPVEPQWALEHLFVRTEEAGDLALYLYRNPGTRQIVVDFYLEVTGDSRITMPILIYADRYEIPLPLAFALAWVESSYRIRAVNHNQDTVDRGLFQLNSRSFPRLSEKECFDPYINARYGLAHLRYCLSVGESEVIALAMYNAGTHGVTRGTPFNTLKHVSRIVEYKEGLENRFQRRLFQSDSIARLAHLARAF